MMLQTSCSFVGNSVTGLFIVDRDKDYNVTRFLS